MRIAVIAAQGRSGQAFVHEALKAGHTVKAGIRGEDPFRAHSNLKTIQCDATDKTQVTELIDHCDAVVSLIGHVKGSSDLVQTDATKAIITAMEVAGIKRFVSLTGVGVGVKSSRAKRFVELLSKITTKIGIKRLEDGRMHAKVLESSTLDWTVLQVLLLTSGKPGKFDLATQGVVKAPTPRREVARAILRILEEELFVRQYPLIVRKNAS